MTTFAANVPFLMHVFGAMVLVGAVATAVVFSLVSWARTEPSTAADAARRTFRTLLFVAFPAWWVMRIGAQWLYNEQGWEDVPEEPAWIGIGYMTAEAGGLLLLIGIILSGIGARRLRRAEGGSSPLVRVTSVLVSIALLAWVVTVWAMSGKPS